MADDGGLKVDGTVYPIPTTLRVGETRTIKRMTGLNPAAFMEELNKLDETGDPDVGAAFVWWVVHRADPSFTPEQTDDIEWNSVAGEKSDEPAPVLDPKASGEPTSSSPISAGASSSTSESPAGETIPASGGSPGLALYALPT